MHSGMAAAKGFHERIDALERGEITKAEAKAQMKQIHSRAKALRFGASKKHPAGKGKMKMRLPRAKKQPR